METLTLIDGTVLNGHILDNGDGIIIFVYLDNMSIIDGFGIFTNKANIERIVAENHGHEETYTGYTELTSISTEYGNCNAILRRAVGE